MLPRITFMLLRRFRTILSTLILGLVMVAPLSVMLSQSMSFRPPQLPVDLMVLRQVLMAISGLLKTMATILGG